MVKIIFMDQSAVTTAYNRISPFIIHTPTLQSSILNKFLDSHIYFKFEGMQRIGAFKARGALNTLLALKEKGKLPKEIVAFSSGNHSQAVAWAASFMGIKSTIILPSFTSPIKIQATRAYGGNVILTDEREEAEEIAHEKAKTAFLLPPYDNDDVIAGQGTAAFESWNDIGGFDAVFAPCSGGGLISGTYLATRLFSSTTQVFASEPEMANDAAQSFRIGTIQKLPASPMTIADGARTLSLVERTFQYIKKLNGIYEVSEKDIIYWTQWLTHLLKINVEPTAALGMAGAHQWIKEGNVKNKILVILSGGNIDSSTYKKIWDVNHLEQIPS